MKFIAALSVNQIIFGRFFIGAVLALLLYKNIKKSLHSPIPIFLPGLMTLYYVCATYSFFSAPVAVVALLIATSPLFTLLVRYLNKEKLHANELMGFVIAFIGLLLYFNDGQALGHYSTYSIVVGSILAILAALIRAVYSFYIWQRTQQQKAVDLSLMNLSTLIIGCMFFLPFLGIDPLPQTFDWHSAIALLGLGGLATFLPNFLNNVASKNINPTLHNIIGMTTPLTAAIMAWIWLDEAQTVLSLSAMLIVLFGVYISAKVPRSLQTGKDSPR